MARDGNPAEIWDYLDLALLRLAKLGRRPLPNIEDAAEFYDAFFTANDVEVMASGEDLRRKYRAETLRSAAWSAMPHGAAVLDVGCGTGDNLRDIYREDARLFGLEYAGRTVQIARDILKGRAAVKQGSAAEIPFDDGEFDLVMCIEVLEHLEQDQKACDDIARVLKPGGVLILSLPYRHWFPYYFKAMGHLRHYTRGDIAQLLAASGLSVAQYLPNFPRWSRFANYAYIVCRIYALLLRCCGVRRNPVEARLPFSATPLMEQLFASIARLRNIEAGQDYSALSTSTFVLARKSAPAASAVRR